MQMVCCCAVEFDWCDGEVVLVEVDCLGVGLVEFDLCLLECD